MTAQISVNHYMHELYTLNKQPRRFLKGVCRFIEEHSLIPTSYDLVLALSGGADSMALLPLAAYYRQHIKAKLNIRVLYVDHQTRLSQANERDLVLKNAKRFGFDVQILRFKTRLDLDQNFEAQARRLRREVLLKECRKNEVIFLGHHLDDSFEWWLMQQMRSSRTDQLGIPLINGRVRRPFLCAQKWQLERLLKELELSFIDDPTNVDTRFERNDLRHSVVPALERRYPKRIKHYVHRSNVLALQQRRHVYRVDDRAVIKKWARGVSLSASDWKQKKDPLRVERLRQMVHELDPHKRSELVDELYKILVALRHGKKGPHHLGPGIYAYLWGQEIFLLRKQDRDFYREWDQRLAADSPGAQIPAGLFSTLPIKQTHKNINGLKEPHPLFPKYCKKLFQKGLSWQTPARAERYFD